MKKLFIIFGFILGLAWLVDLFFGYIAFRSEKVGEYFWYPLSIKIGYVLILISIIYILGLVPYLVFPKINFRYRGLLIGCGIGLIAGFVMGLLTIFTNDFIFKFADTLLGPSSPYLTGEDRGYAVISAWAFWWTISFGLVGSFLGYRVGKRRESTPSQIGSL